LACPGPDRARAGTRASVPAALRTCQASPIRGRLARGVWAGPGRSGPGARKGQAPTRLALWAGPVSMAAGQWVAAAAPVGPPDFGSKFGMPGSARTVLTGPLGSLYCHVAGGLHCVRPNPRGAASVLSSEPESRPPPPAARGRTRRRASGAGALLRSRRGAARREPHGAAGAWLRLRLASSSSKFFVPSLPTDSEPGSSLSSVLPVARTGFKPSASESSPAGAARCE
jgi:hypothetical protein